ncbi:unnamed protein product [Notodromas monacha]|uniref:Tumor necrosis factor alpha-induced protein 8-like protein n=1 Tax=Notodromas monacha TaxID=399045 RepID=A0A7R9G909_9CRUS|nr:unnamed protein product [Notodromas monacha]CAG0912349.1 unnamed protein product [Notodromas monacha]
MFCCALDFLDLVDDIFETVARNDPCNSQGAGASNRASREVCARGLMADAFRARDIGLRAQKKLLSRMTSHKGMVKVLIDDNSGQLLDNLYRFVKHHTGSKKDAEKIVKNIIKLSVKAGILSRNEQFSQDEIQLGNDFVRKFHTLAKTVISFHEVDFTYDRGFISKQISECHDLFAKIISRHLSEKSLSRLDNVFGFFSDPNFLDQVFQPKYPHRELFDKLVNDLKKALDEGDL